MSGILGLVSRIPALKGAVLLLAPLGYYYWLCLTAIQVFKNSRLNFGLWKCVFNTTDSIKGLAVFYSYNVKIIELINPPAKRDRTNDNFL